MKKITSAMRRLEARHQLSGDADPTDFGVISLEDVEGSSDVVLYCRVSNRTQNHSANLKDQIANCRSEIQQQGHTVIDAFGEVAAGWEVSKSDRWKLVAASSEANRQGAILVVETIDRLIRNWFFHPSRDPDVIPTIDEFAELRRQIGPVTIATIVPLDAPRFGENGIRSFEIKRGQSQKQRRGGRPRNFRPGEKKQRRLETLPLAVSKRVEGLSIRKIATELGIPKSTIARWLKDVH